MESAWEKGIQGYLAKYPGDALVGIPMWSYARNEIMQLVRKGRGQEESCKGRIDEKGSKST
jgi:hypothetical protein